MAIGRVDEEFIGRPSQPHLLEEGIDLIDLAGELHDGHAGSGTVRGHVGTLGG